MKIASSEKLEWCKELIEKTRDIRKIDFAYIRIDNIEVTPPTPPVLSVQVIDDDEVFLLHPNYSYMSTPFHPCIYIKSVAAAKIFSDYYLQIWEKAARNQLDFGCLIKRGKKVYQEHLEEIAQRLGE